MVFVTHAHRHAIAESPSAARVDEDVNPVSAPSELPTPQLRALFSKYDVDDDGHITFEELSAVITQDLKNHTSISESEIRELYGSLDLDGDGQVVCAVCMCSGTGTEDACHSVVVLTDMHHASLCADMTNLRLRCR